MSECRNHRIWIELACAVASRAPCPASHIASEVDELYREYATRFDENGHPVEVTPDGQVKK